MANRERGEVMVRVDGKDYTLVLSINAIIELEELLSTPEKEVSYQDVVAKAHQLKYLRLLFWAALRDYHQEMSLADTGRFIHAVGVANLAPLISGLSGQATPDPEDVTVLGLNGSKRPRKAHAGRLGGTGNSSTVTRAVSA